MVYFFKCSNVLIIFLVSNLYCQMSHMLVLMSKTRDRSERRWFPCSQCAREGGPESGIWDSIFETQDWTCDTILFHALAWKFISNKRVRKMSKFYGLDKLPVSSHCNSYLLLISQILLDKIAFYLLSFTR